MAHSATRAKLTEFTDTVAFEALCCALLVGEYKRIVPLGGSGDLGRDAIEPAPLEGAYQNEDASAIFQYSLQKNWKTKVEAEIEKVFSNGFRPKRYIFVSDRQATTQARNATQRHAKEKYGVDAQVYDISWIQARLESPEYLHLRRQYLGLEISTLPAFLTNDEYETRRIDRYRAPDLPVFIGREAEHKRIKDFLVSDRKVLLLSAPPGVGKTKLMLEIARDVGDFQGDVRFLRPEAESVEAHLDELDPLNKLLLLVDDAQEFENLRQLIALLMAPEFKDRTHLVMATHPWAKDRLAGEFASRAIPYEEMDLPRMTDGGIDEFIQHPEIGVTDENARRAVVRVSEGNPLVAVIASALVRETGDLSALTRHQVIAAHFKRALQNAFPPGRRADEALLLLATISATKGIEYPQYLPTLAEATGITENNLDSLVDKLQSMGLLKRSWSGLRVISELLAEHLVLEMFFAPGHPFNFREKVLSPFFSKKGNKIFRSLAEAERSGASGATGIIDEFMRDALAHVREPDALRHQAVLQWLEGFAFLRPEESLLILRSIVEAPSIEPGQIDSKL